MSEKDVKKDGKSAEIEGAEVEPLTDEDLESVPGGATRTDCSCTSTTGNCTSGVQ